MSSIFRRGFDRTRHIFQLFCPCCTLLAELLFASFACILLCDHIPGNGKIIDFRFFSFNLVSSIFRRGFDRTRHIFQLFCPCCTLLAELLFASFACILLCDHIPGNGKIIDFRFFSFNLVSSIFRRGFDRTRHIFQLFCPCCTLLAELLFASFACILLCDHIPAYGKIIDFRFFSFNLVSSIFRRGFDRTRHIFQLFCPCCTLLAELLFASFACILLCDHIPGNGKIIDFRFFLIQLSVIDISSRV